MCTPHDGEEVIQLFTFVNVKMNISSKKENAVIRVNIKIKTLCLLIPVHVLK